LKQTHLKVVSPEYIGFTGKRLQFLAWKLNIIKILRMITLFLESIYLVSCTKHQIKSAIT